MPRQQGYAGETNEWYTPPEIFRTLGVEFDLDPCSPPNGLGCVPALKRFTYFEDGLAQKWEGRVWLNPPYGPHTVRWLARLADHGNGIALVFARTDVQWFQKIAPRADLVCFVSGRIRFLKPNGTQAGSAAAPNALMAFGTENAQTLLASGLGVCGRLE